MKHNMMRGRTAVPPTEYRSYTAARRDRYPTMPPSPQHLHRIMQPVIAFRNA